MFTVWRLQVKKSGGWNWIIQNIFGLKDKARLENICLQPEYYLNLFYYLKKSSAKNALTWGILVGVIVQIYQEF